MKNIHSFSFCILISTLSCLSTFGQPISVPSDYPTIQEAINASSSGDTVLVSDGTYDGTGNDNITLNGKEIVIKSENGPEHCIIDGTSAGTYAAGFVSGYVPVSNNAVIEGFTIQNFSMMGIYIFGSSPVIKNNLIKNCQTAVSCSGGSRSIIEGNEITGNITGLDMASSHVSIIGNYISGNEVSKSNHGIIHCSGNDTSYVANNIIKDNLGCAIYLENAKGAQIIGNEINKNRVENLTTYHQREYNEYNWPYQLYTGFEDCGGAIYVSGYSLANIRNNLIINNQAGHTGGIFCEEGSVVIIANNTMKNNTSFMGGSITTMTSSAVVQNNIITHSGSLNTETRLDRWFYNNLLYQVEYEGVLRKAVHYYYGFRNNGETGEVSITGKMDTTFTMNAGERIWLKATSLVTEDNQGGGLDITISLGDDYENLDIQYDGVTNGSCISLYDVSLQSFGSREHGMSGAGIVASGTLPFENIQYNMLYSNSGDGLVLQNIADFSDMNTQDLPDDLNNASSDPHLDYSDFSLKDGSPCIDAGNSEVSYNDGNLPPGKGSSRNDQGVTGGPFNGDIEGFSSAGCANSYAILDETACGTYVFRGRLLEASGTYYDTLSNYAGCDSIITLNLTVIVVDTSVNVFGSTLSSNAANATYQWLDCNNNMAPVAGAENKTFAPETIGNYAVQVTIGGCTATSSCHEVSTVGMESRAGKQAISIYPNPTTGLVTIDPGTIEDLYSICLLNIIGEVIKTFPARNLHELSLDIDGAPGMYFLKFQQEDGNAILRKIIKE